MKKRYRMVSYDVIHDIWVVEERWWWFFWLGISAGSKSACEEFLSRQG